MEWGCAIASNATDVNGNPLELDESAVVEKMFFD